MDHTCWLQGKGSKRLSFDTLRLKCLVGDTVKPVRVWGSGGSPKKRTSQTDNDTIAWVAAASADKCLPEMHKRVKIFSAALQLISVSLSGETGSCGRSQLCRSAAAEYLYQRHLQPCISLSSPPRGDPLPFIFHLRPRPSFTATCNLNTKVTHCQWQLVCLTTLAVCVAKRSLINVTDKYYIIGESKNSPSIWQQSGSETWNLYVQRTSAWTPHMTAMGNNTTQTWRINSQQQITMYYTGVSASSPNCYLFLHCN